VNKGSFKPRNHRAARLTEDTVRWALDRYFIDRWTQRRIALATGVSLGTIGRITRGETWLNVPRPAPLASADMAPLPPEVIEKFRPSNRESPGDPIEEFLRKRKGT
jgi:transcriptional regulator with XRE-family HTH domain